MNESKILNIGLTISVKEGLLHLARSFKEKLRLCMTKQSQRDCLSGAVLFCQEEFGIRVLYTRRIGREEDCNSGEIQYQ